MFVALARMPRGETRAAAVLEFDAGVPVAWVPSLATEEEQFAEPESLVEAGAPPPPSFDPPPLPSREAGELEPDPSFTELPAIDDERPAPTSPQPPLWTEPRVSDVRLPRRSAPSPSDSGGPAADSPSGRVVAAVARSHGNAAPDYPREARRQGIEGVVLLRVAIAADGSCSGVSIEKSSGSAALDAAALAAVKRWKFEPALQEGVAVASELLVPIRFVLKAGGAG